jgi:hypothetical protein
MVHQLNPLLPLQSLLPPPSQECCIKKAKQLKETIRPSVGIEGGLRGLKIKEHTISTTPTATKNMTCLLRGSDPEVKAKEAVSEVRVAREAMAAKGGLEAKVDRLVATYLEAKVVRLVATYLEAKAKDLTTMKTMRDMKTVRATKTKMASLPWRRLMHATSKC